MVINKVSDEYDDDAIVDLAGNALEVCVKAHAGHMRSVG